jgi:hypothetical protein
MKLKLLSFILFLTATVFGQVDQIKNKSSENSSRKESSGGSSSGGSSGSSYFFFEMFRVVGTWQAYKLEKRETNPRIVSFEAFAQAAIQPSNYYLINPRVRGNWGLFSTDFRFNWLIEQNISGNKELSTFDWQIIQLNLITTKSVTGRVGMGSYFENFGSNQSFFEVTFGISVFPENWPLAANAEYRVANDFETGAVPRREFNFSLERPLFTAGRWHGNATLGGVYQRYYESVSVWGIQAGLALRVY